jgi:hypothetical protein
MTKKTDSGFDELWLFRVPQNFNPKMLSGLKVSKIENKETIISTDSFTCARPCLLFYILFIFVYSLVNYSQI